MLHRIVLLMNGLYLIDSVGLGCNETRPTPFEAQALAAIRRQSLGGNIVLVNDGKPIVW